MTDIFSYTDLQIYLDSIWNSYYKRVEEEGYVVIGAYDDSANENRNPLYHDITDELSLIDWNYLTSVAKMILATVLNFVKRHS